MSRHLGLDIAPDDGTGITLTYTDPAGTGTALARGFPVLDAAKLDDLRRGDSPADTVDSLTNDVSSWILGNELAQLLSQALGGNERLRVLVRIDRKLLGTLSDLPVELMTLPQALQPMVLHPNVNSMVHVPPGLGTSPAPPVRDWPLRVLIVRSNPEDLGKAVPPARPIRQEILDAASGMPEGAVQVEVLSSEDDGAEPVTWKRFRDTLASQVFDVFVYLGHGDLQQAFAETQPVGYLQFESADRKVHESIDARRIAAELLQHPVRVVVLAGCLTAAQLAEAEQVTQDLVATALPQWLRGAQGVAQAIIDSEAPVELAVGMRDRLEVGHANVFLAAFFKSLIKTSPGDVERAIRAGRDDLWGNAPVPPTWSSAVVFVKGSAPVFQFLSEPPPQALFSAEKQGKLDSVRELRRVAAKLFIEALSDRTPFFDALVAVAAQEKAVLGKDAMVRPRLVRSPTGAVEVEVELLGFVKTGRLAGKVAIGGESVAIDRLVADPRLDAAGFTFLWGDVDAGKARFLIEAGGGSPVKLTAGRLFTIRATIGSISPAIHEVVVTHAQSDTKAVVWSGMDLIAVVP